MLLPMFGFLFALMLLGAVTLPAAFADRRHPALTPKPYAPYVGFGALFAGLGAFVLSLGLAALGYVLTRSDTLSAFGFLGGYVLGGCGGAALGVRQAYYFNHPKH